MAVTVQADDYGDLVALTLRDLGPNKFEQIAAELQDYEVMGKWLKADKVMFGDGYGIQRNLMYKTSGAASHVGLDATDSAGIPDLTTQLQVPWRHAITSWAFDRREALMNRGKSMITNVLLPRRTGAMIDLAQELEEKAWAAPSSSTENLTPYGLPYYIVYNATDGFTGGAASGHTTVAGVDLTTAANYKNYSVTYTTVDKPDLIKKMRTGKRKIGWKSPVKSHDYTGNAGKNLRIYVDEATVASLEDIGESQNENLGRDLAPYGGVKDVGAGELMFRGHPIIWVPYLDSTGAGTATGAVYMVDHGTFYPVVLEGDYIEESKPIMAPGQHNKWRVFTDLSYNFICLNRRRNAVFATAA